MRSLIANQFICKVFTKHRSAIQFLVLFIFFLGTGWVWHYSNHEDGELKLYGLQAIAEIIVAVFETIATFLMIKSIKQNGEANREMKKMNEALQSSMRAQTDVLKKQQEFYAVLLKEKQEEIRKMEKTKVLNRYISYVKNFLFAYNRGEDFDGVDTAKLFIEKSKRNKTTNGQNTLCLPEQDYNDKNNMLMAILELKLTTSVDMESYIFANQNPQTKENKIILTANDKDVKENFDCLLREYKYKLRTKLPMILGKYFENFDENEELQEICG